jgi:MraZ protein
MNTLFGRATATLDAKGRISLPAKYRKLLPEEVVIAKEPAVKDENGLEIRTPALIVYTLDDFNIWLDALVEGKGGVDATDVEQKETIEDIAESAEYVKVDTAGRIPITDELCLFAQIDKEVVFSGARDHLVVRSLANWEINSKQRASNAKAYKVASS